MVVATRDCLTIPNSKVDIKRLFSNRRDILSISRFTLKGSTLRDLHLGTYT